MFGEEESESPRVPSPWDSLISTPALASSPLSQPAIICREETPPLAAIPKLVPEADDGNVEYKLQLLNPSAPRFARLVTQLKWRLLEGGGQAYYELGVADSGALVGLRRSELEQTLETLETMAGEIGASVIVVKEIEVPTALTTLAMMEDHSGSYRRREAFRVNSDASSTTETDTDVDIDSDAQLSYDTSSSSIAIFSMDPDSSEASESETTPAISFDIEISTVFKPRPFRMRSAPGTPAEHHNKKMKRKLNQLDKSTGDLPATKGEKRRQARDRRREKRRKTLGVAVLAPDDDQTGELVAGLESLHVSLDHPHEDDNISSINLTDIDGDDDVFATPAPVIHSFAKKVQVQGGDASDGEARLIVEALVVRKMSIEEAFLDFGGFALA